MASTELGAALAGLQAALVLPEPDEAFDGEAWNDAFQAALDRVLALNDPTAVEGLLSLLDDDCELQDVLWSLMHGAERFPLESYLAGLIAAVPRLAMTAGLGPKSDGPRAQTSSRPASNGSPRRSAEVGRCGWLRL